VRQFLFAIVPCLGITYLSFSVLVTSEKTKDLVPGWSVSARP